LSLEFCPCFLKYLFIYSYSYNSNFWSKFSFSNSHIFCSSTWF